MGQGQPAGTPLMGGTDDEAHLLAGELVERKLHKAIAALVQVLNLLVAGVPLQWLTGSTEGHLPRHLGPC